MIFKKKVQGKAQPLIEMVRDYLISKEVYFEISSDGLRISISYTGEPGRWITTIMGHIEDDVLILRSEFPFTTADNLKVSITDLLNRLNQKILIGKYYMCPIEGTIAYESCHFLGGRSICNSEIAFLISITSHFTEFAFQPIAQVLFANAEPALLIN